MTQLVCLLLTLLFALSSPEVEGNAAFRQSSFAAKTGGLAKAGDIPATGIARFDQLAVNSPHWAQFIRGVEARGFRVRAQTLIPEQAYIRPGNRTFYYNPDKMTVLDMRHEMRHFQQFKQAGNLRTGGGLGARYEVEAYRFEQGLGSRHGFSSEYMDYLKNQMRYYGGQ